MVQEILKKLDFSEKEIEIYLAILKNGKIIPSDLAHITGIKRSTVYSVASELVSRGLIAEDHSSPIKYLVAIPLDELNKLVKKDEEKINTKKQLIASAIKELKNFTSDTKYSVPKIYFVADEELENFLYKRTDAWETNSLKTEPCWYGYQDHTFVEYYSAYIDWQWSRASKEISLKLITNKSDIEKVMEKRQYPRRKIKYFKKKLPFTASTWVIGDYIIMIFTNQRPHYAIEISNAEFAKNQRELFKFLWDVLE